MAYTPKNANGQATMANSSPVVVASDQTKIKVDLTETTANSVAIKVDGSAVTQPISAVSLPLPSTAATSTKQSDGSQKTQVVDGSGNVIGATSNALDINIKSGNPTSIAATQSGTWNVGLSTGSNAIGSITNTSFAATQSTASNLKAEVSNAGTFATQATTSTATGDTTLQNAVSATGNGSSLTVTGYGVAVLQVSGTFTATINFEGSSDAGTTWTAISGTQIGAADISTTATTTGLYRFSCTGLDLIRARVTWTSGTSVTVFGRATNAILSNKVIKLATGTNIVGKVGIDQTTNGTTNNVTNRDVTYNKLKCDAGTLVANTAATASLTVSTLTAVELEITNISGASTIYYTLDNSTPSSTNFSGILPATPSSVVLPCNGTPTLKLISAGTPTWGAVVRGV